MTHWFLASQFAFENEHALKLISLVNTISEIFGFQIEIMFRVIR